MAIAFSKPHMNKNDRGYVILGLKIVGDFGATIAVPVVIFAWLGKTLDERWGTAPWMLILGFVTAAILTSVVIHRKAKAYGKAFNALDTSVTEDQPETK